MKPSRVVGTKYGLVEGVRLVDDGDCQIDAYLGIPFAKPPIGALRFKKPEPPDAWEGIRKTVKFGPRAPQKEFIWSRWMAAVKTDEDCLYLNVFSPVPTAAAAENQFSVACLLLVIAITSNEKLNEVLHQNGLAVMVFVHGGGFLIDSASKYGDIGICNNLCRHDVVVVTVQYRLGLLGFFCTGDEACPGNNGLWDQAMALKWVQDNISAFNGDPGRITVFGQSAGGACVDLLSLSPVTRGY
ncbi:unnamed protein product [Gongylonema pulchrum]|uniref:COesterase domain-containing protein n=1 Tax=Gongylonema pulchrum TaxID=637853 RepID=A0A183E3B4_9BILA|nr:unnamed protein product [Gongylonema pulchrum]